MLCTIYDQAVQLVLYSGVPLFILKMF